MSVSGLVVTLSDDDAGEAALTALAGDPRLTIGERFARRVAVVAETPDTRGDLELWEQLRRTPGIVHVDVTFVQVDPGPGPAEPPTDQRSMESPHAQG